MGIHEGNEPDMPITPFIRPPLQPTRALTVLELRRLLSLSRDKMADLLRTTAKSVERWETTGSQPSGEIQRTRLAKLQEIVAWGQAVYTDEGVREFLTTPLPVFEYRTGFQMIEQDQADLVISALIADFEGLGS